LRSFQYREKEQQKTGPAQQRLRPVPQRRDASAYLKLKFFRNLKRAQPKKVPGSRKGEKPSSNWPCARCRTGAWQPLA